MDSTLTLCKALEIATNCHREQVDLNGAPYMLHVLAVANMVDTVEEKVVALLHDVMEDGEVSRSYLEKLFDSKTMDALDLLTKKKGQDYIEYITKLAPNKLARKVKMADLTNNMDIRRLDDLGQKDLERMAKYHRAWTYLKKYEESQNSIHH